MATLASVTSVTVYCCPQLFPCGYFGLCYVRCKILLPPVLHVWLLWPLLRPLQNTAASSSSRVVTMASVTSVAKYCCLQFFTCGYYGLCYVRYGILLPPVLHMWLLWPLLRPLRNTAASSSSHVVTMASVTSVTVYCCLQFFTCGYYGLCYVRFHPAPRVFYVPCIWSILWIFHVNTRRRHNETQYWSAVCDAGPILNLRCESISCLPQLSCICLNCHSYASTVITMPQL